jgi:hypothetical protein
VNATAYDRSGDKKTYGYQSNGVGTNLRAKIFGGSARAARSSAKTQTDLTQFYPSCRPESFCRLLGVRKICSIVQGQYCQK